MNLRSTSFRSFVKVFIETFTITFLAEWGDKSQAATVFMAAASVIFLLFDWYFDEFEPFSGVHLEVFNLETVVVF